MAPAATLQLPAPDGDGLPSVDAATEDDAFAVLAIDGGWRQCPMWRGPGAGGTIAAGDAAAALAGIDHVAGMHDAPNAAGNPQRFWVGGSEDDAARAFGGTAVVRVGGRGVDRDPGRLGVAGGAPRADRARDGSCPRGRWLPMSTLRPSCLADSVGGPDAAVFEAPVDGDPLQRLIAHSGWTRCRMWQRVDQTAAPDGEAIDAAADASGLGDASGWVTTTVPADRRHRRPGGPAARSIRIPPTRPRSTGRASSCSAPASRAGRG